MTTTIINLKTTTILHKEIIMDFFAEPEAYPGYNEEVDLLEYEKIKDHVNDKYDCDMSAIEVRSEFESAYNKLFDNLMQDHSHEIFNIIYVLMDCFNINEVKAVRYLSEDNKEILRVFAINNRETAYYQKMENVKEKAKMEKKGLKFFEHINVDDLFE